jgi:hypothetical protein
MLKAINILTFKSCSTVLLCFYEVVSLWEVKNEAKETEEINNLTCAIHPNAGCKFQSIKTCSRMRRNIKK